MTIMSKVTLSVVLQKRMGLSPLKVSSSFHLMDMEIFPQGTATVVSGLLIISSNIQISVNLHCDNACYKIFYINKFELNNVILQH